MQLRLLLLLIVCYLALVDTTHAKSNKKKKPKTETELPEVGSHKKPLDMPVGVHCAGCQSIVRETLKILGDKKSRGDVLDAIEQMCVLSKFFEADLIAAPLMRSACQSILREFASELEEHLMNRESDNFTQVVSYFCGNGKMDSPTRACYNLSMAQMGKDIARYLKPNHRELPVPYYFMEAFLNEDGSLKKKEDQRPRGDEL